MQTQATVSRLLRCCVPLMHAARWQVLRDVAVSAVSGRALTLTALEIGTVRTTSVRHRVKCVDQLLANPHLESERIDTYRALAHEWLGDVPQLLIVVDWSKYRNFKRPFSRSLDVSGNVSDDHQAVKRARNL